MARYAIRAAMTGAGALLLGACGASDADYNEVHVDATEARAQARIDAAANAVGTRTEAMKGVPVSSSTPDAGRSRAFPTAFEGYWSVTPNDCRLDNYDAHGRIDVERDTIRLFRNKARVERIDARSPQRVDAVLRFSGDAGGTRATRFQLEQGGTTMLRIEPREGGGAPLTTRYQRC